MTRILTCHVGMPKDARSLQLRSAAPYVDLELIPKDAPGIPGYKLGFKLMLPLTVEPPFLFLDGDIVFTRDPARHLRYDGIWASRSGLDRWFATGLAREGTRRPSREALAIQEEFGVLIDGTYATDAAVFHFPYVPDGYEEDLQRYLALPFVKEERERKGKLEPMLDQHFLAIIMAKERGLVVHGGSRLEPTHPLHGAYVACASWKCFVNRQRFGNGTLMHYNISTKKQEAIDLWTPWLLPGKRGFRPERQPRPPAGIAAAYLRT